MPMSAPKPLEEIHAYAIALCVGRFAHCNCGPGQRAKAFPDRQASKNGICEMWDGCEEFEKLRWRDDRNRFRSHENPRAAVSTVCARDRHSSLHNPAESRKASRVIADWRKGAISSGKRQDAPAGGG